MVQAMDLSPTPTNTTKTTPDTDTETPPLLQPTRSLSFTNGTLKPHHHHHHPHAPPHAPPQMVVSYRECLKNHAASIGGHALDGCGEFMPCPAAVSSDPTSLKCAACGCHRNFHRREQPTSKPLLHSFHNGPFQLLNPPPPLLSSQPLHRSSSPSLSPSPSSSPGPTPSPHSPPPVSHLPPNSYFASPPQMLLALSTGFSSEPSDDHHHTHQSFNPTAAMKSSPETNPNSRKRFRTKFSQEQKEKMCLFAEKLGWKMQRSEERLVEEFCKEVGVRKGVLKVWMHNNKHTLGKRERGVVSHSHNHNLVDEASNGDDIGGRVLSFDSNPDNEANENHNDEDRRANFNFFANGSSSSS